MQQGQGVRRGEVFRVDLSSQGGLLAKTRLVVVVQNDIGNRYSSETIVAAIRDIHGDRQLPVHVRVPAGMAGLYKDSMVDAGHLLTVPQEVLVGPLGKLPLRIMASLSLALARSLGLA